MTQPPSAIRSRLPANLSFDSTDSNSVHLFFRFESGSTSDAVELEEFFISFFDFGLDLACGSAASPECAPLSP